MLLETIKFFYELLLTIEREALPFCWKLFMGRW